MQASSNVSERALEPPGLGVSVVILALGPCPDNAESLNARRGTWARPTLWIPLVKRIRQPFLGDWALPGGDITAGVSLEDAARDALESTTKLRPGYLEQLYTFGDPSRSHGGLPMISIVYWALIGATETKDFIESNNVRWFPTDDLPALAFDHRDIIEYALTRVRNKIEYTDLATRLVGETFTLTQLRHVHEAISGTTLDPANFRRKMLASGLIVPTGGQIASGRHRPAKLYRYVAHQSPHTARLHTIPRGKVNVGGTQT